LQPRGFVSATGAHPPDRRRVQAGHLLHHGRRRAYERPGDRFAHQGQDPVLEEKNFIEAAEGLSAARTSFSSTSCGTICRRRSSSGRRWAWASHPHGNELELSGFMSRSRRPRRAWSSRCELLLQKLWPSTVPAMAILFAILGFHLLGDGLNNLLERKTVH
jgi:hypothetical protein